jgi:hypothetical protein
MGLVALIKPHYSKNRPSRGVPIDAYAARTSAAELVWLQFCAIEPLEPRRQLLTRAEDMRL